MSERRPLFSILHTSARPDKWREVYRAWMLKAAHFENVEYVLCIDKRWGFTAKDARDAQEMSVVVVENEGRRCYVDGVNTAARASSGSILIVNADDQFPCEGWDTRLCEAICTRLAPGHDLLRVLEGEPSFVVEVSTGTDYKNIAEHDRGILVMPILSRARYEQQGGNVFHPEYESMFADNDFCEWARQDGVLIDARHLMFPHKHWVNGGRVWDAADQVQNRKEAFEQGRVILERRRAEKFGALNLRKEPGESQSCHTNAPIRTIALCLPGEHFEGPWVDGLFALYAHLMQRGFNVVYLRDYTSNVYVTREEIRQALLASQVKIDLALWIDDDNTCSPSQFDALLADLDAHPEVDGITAWCWIHNEDKAGFHPSCGVFAPDFAHWQPFPNSLVNETELKPVEVGGFPCFLMRMSAIEKAGERPFIRGILDESLPHGIGGEDLGFFKAAQQGGATFLVDPRVRVPHLKWVTVEPIIPSEGKPEVKIAVMLRVKNEARWIARVIDSVIGLGPVFVMDDGSTDKTKQIAQSHGAWVYTSEFIGQPLDEARDKNWLLAVVKEACAPDWVLCIDGDEELEPSGVDKIRRACESGKADVYGLRVLYLWDKPNQARFDGIYAGLSRFSLFRCLPNLKFESMYEGKDGGQGKPPHTGLHTGNAPFSADKDIVGSALNVWLLHYGYMLKEDRLKKFEWYSQVDPGNELEDCYRHIVQGDLPSVPASAKLKHAGPLELRTIPRSIAPDFDMSSLLASPVPARAAAIATIDERRRRESRPTFSVLHPTARLPLGWLAAYEEWSRKRSRTQECEYLLCVQYGDEGKIPLDLPSGIPLHIVTNFGRDCVVDKVNTLAKEARGHVLVCAEDDYFPCENWDSRLLEVIPNLDGKYTVMVDSQYMPGLMSHPIMTRAYYERYGYLVYPEYISTGADNDLTERAIKDGVMIFADGSRGAAFPGGVQPHIRFEHRHASELDEVALRQHSRETKAVRDFLLPRRRADGFPKEIRNYRKLAQRPEVRFDEPHAYFNNPEVREVMRVNLGCSDRLETGFVNVDICEPADLVADLRERWPWEDSIVDEIRAWDIIEHLPDKIHTMNEAFRVLKPGGKLDIIVPTTEGRGAFQDPTHVSFWNRNSFFYFESGNPHLHRFERAYGMRCAFRVVNEEESSVGQGVTKLHIVLEAVKASVSMAAD